MFHIDKLAIAVVLISTVLAGCIPRHPEQTARPEVIREPFELRSVTSASGHEYRYLFAPGPSADAPAMVLLPGGIFDNRIWLYADGLSEHFNLYAPDWPDNSLYYTGNSTDYGEIVADFLDALGLDEIYLVAVSMGAYAAVDLASRKKDAVEIRALVLASAVMFAINEEEVEERSGYGELALKLSPGRMQAVVEWQAERTEYDEAPGEIQQKDIFWVRPYVYYFQVFSMTANQGAAKQDTMSIDCPVLFLHGTDDETMPIETARLNPTVFQDAEWVELEGLKHSMAFSHGPQMVEAILAWLEQRELLPKPGDPVDQPPTPNQPPPEPLAKIGDPPPPAPAGHQWVSLFPIQCLGNPWEQALIQSGKPATEVARMDELVVVRDYFAKGAVAIHDLRKVELGKAVCEACSCSNGYRIDLLVDKADVPAVERLKNPNPPTK